MQSRDVTPPTKSSIMAKRSEGIQFNSINITPMKNYILHVTCKYRLHVNICFWQLDRVNRPTLYKIASNFFKNMIRVIY